MNRFIVSQPDLYPAFVEAFDVYDAARKMKRQQEEQGYEAVDGDVLEIQKMLPNGELSKIYVLTWREWLKNFVMMQPYLVSVPYMHHHLFIEAESSRDAAELAAGSFTDDGNNYDVSGEYHVYKYGEDGPGALIGSIFWITAPPILSIPVDMLKLSMIM